MVFRNLGFVTRWSDSLGVILSALKAEGVGSDRDALPTPLIRPRPEVTPDESFGFARHHTALHHCSSTILPGINRTVRYSTGASSPSPSTARMW